jgi:hypothetical protein
VSDASGSYMYTVSLDLKPGPLGAIRGLRGGELRIVEQQGLTAVVSSVDLDEFGEAGLQRNLEDLRWLEEVARAHDAVVQHVAGLGPVAPLRLATICRTDDAVRRRLEEWHDDLIMALDRVAYRDEWSVKVIHKTVRAAGPAAPPVESGTPGADYLQRRRAEMAAARQSTEDLAVLADVLHRELSRGAAASRRINPQDPRLSGHDGTMILNGAYLVDSNREDDFSMLVEDVASRHPELLVELNGPWPPYSFATLDQR